MNQSRKRKDCRACRTVNLRDVLTLGDQPLANAFVKPDDLGREEATYPLTVRECGTCGMVQLANVVSAETMFRDYLFLTSSSKGMTEHFASLMASNVERYVPHGGLVVEIGANDGTALESIVRSDVRRIGVDPAKNIAVMAASRGVPIIPEFFTEFVAKEMLKSSGAHLIVACNVLGHIDDLDDVLRGVNWLLDDDGAFVFEVPYLGDMVDHNEFDLIYHEHLSYFAVRPLVWVLNRFGLRLESVVRKPVHGGTIRCTAVVGSGAAPDIDAWLDRERHPVDWREFMLGVNDVRLMMRGWLSELRADGKTAWGYGAPAKGTVMLNYCRIGTDLLPCVVDSTPLKQGLHVPGTHQVIRSPEDIATEHPDAILILAWNHTYEIMVKVRDYLTRGGIVATPFQFPALPSDRQSA